MAKMFNPTTGEILDQSNDLNTSVPQRTQTDKPVYADKTFKIDADISDYNIDTQKAIRNFEKQQKKSKPTKSEAVVDEARKKEANFQRLKKKYSNKLPTKEEMESGEFGNYLAEAASRLPKTSEQVTKERKKQELEYAIVSGEQNVITAKKQREDIQKRGEQLSYTDRFLGNLAQGTDELLGGLYALPATAIERTVPDKQLATEFLGDYGRSVKDLQREIAERRTELSSYAPDASGLEHFVGGVGEFAGNLPPLLAGGAIGVGPTALMALQGVTSSIAQGQEEEAFKSGLTGAAMGVLQVGVGEPLGKLAGRAFFGTEGNLLNRIAANATGRAVNAAVGIQGADLENQYNNAPTFEAKKNLLTNAILNFAFFSNKERGPKPSGLTPEYQQALDRRTIEATPEGRQALETFDWLTKLQSEQMREAQKYSADVMYQRETGAELNDPVKWYYSQLRKIVEQKVPNKVTPEQLTKMLKDPKYGIKADDYGYSGLDELIAEKAVRGEGITKQEILDTLDKNKTEINETILGEEGKAPELEYKPGSIMSSDGRQSARVDNENISAEIIPMMIGPYGNTPGYKVEVFNKRNGQKLEQYPFYQYGAAREWLEKSYSNQFQLGRPTKYSAYQILKGGKEGSYRELLLQLPERIDPEIQRMRDTLEIRKVKSFIDPNNPIPWYAVFDRETGQQLHESRSTQSLAQMDIDKMVRQKERMSSSELSYQAPHFEGNKNILAHIRFDEGVSEGGDRQLRIQEVQSDWHQKGRELGYKPTKPTEVPADLIAKVRELSKGFDDLGFDSTNEFLRNINDEGVWGAVKYELRDRPEDLATLQKYRDLKRQVNREQTTSIPDAPFKNTWHELAMKRMLRWAVENGYDEIVWGKGKQHIDLYQGELRRNVDEIRVYHDPRYPEKFTVEGHKNGERVIERSGLSKDKVSELIGPELGNKLITEAIEKSKLPDAIQKIHEEKNIIRQKLQTPGINDAEAHQLAGRYAELGRLEQEELWKNANVADLKKESDRLYGLMDSGLLSDDEFLQVSREYKKITEQVGEREKQATANRYASASGEDLSIGGRVHKLLYDEKIPQFIKKIAKKFGAEYKENGKTTVGEYSEPPTTLRRTSTGWEALDLEGNSLGTFKDQVDADLALVNKYLPDITLKQEDAVPETETSGEVPEEWHALLPDGKHYIITDEEGYRSQAIAYTREDLVNMLSSDIAFKASTTKKTTADVHSLKLNDAIKNEILYNGQPLYNRAKLQRETGSPYTKQEQGIHYQWNVRKWNPVDNGGSFLDNMDIARWTAVDTSRGPNVYTNSSGLGFINALYSVSKTHGFGDILNPNMAAFDKMTELLAGNKGYSYGMAVPLETVRQFREAIGDIYEPEFQKQIDSVKNEIDNALQMADKGGKSAVVFLSLDAPNVIETLRHEEIHRTQFNYEIPVNKYMFDFDFKNKIPKINKIEQSLRNRGYDISKPDVVLQETLAHLGAGQYEILGLSADQAAKAFASMIDHIATNHGVENLRKFNFDPKWKGIVNDTARSAERIRQQVESGTKSAESGRSLFDRLRDWWEGTGRAEGDRGVSEAVSSREPAFARQPWENVDTKFEPPTKAQQLKKYLEDTKGLPFGYSIMDRLKRDTRDSMWPIIKTWDWLTANQTGILPENNAAYLMRNWLGGREKIDKVFLWGVPNARGGFATPGGLPWLFESFKGLSKAEFDSDSVAAIQLMISQRTLELSTKHATASGSKINMTKHLTGISGDQPGNPFVNDIKTAISKVNEIYNSSNPARIARIEEAAKRYREWAHALLDYYHDKGRISTTEYTRLMNSNDLYTDLHRIFDDSDDAMLDSSPAKVGRAVKLFRKASGSEEVISNPYVNLMIQTDQVIREADRNEALNAFVAPIRDVLTNTNNPPSPQVKAMYESLAKKVPMATKDSVKVWNQGKMEHYEFHPELMQALEDWKGLPQSLVLDAANFLNKALRVSIVHSPGFIVRNFTRDLQSRTIASRTNDNITDILNPLAGSKPWDSFKELFAPATAGNRQAFWMYGGGQAGHYMSSRMDYQARLKTAIQDVTKEGNAIVVNTKKAFNFLWETLPKKSEEAGRLAEFNAAFDKAKAEGMDDHNASIKAAFEARDLMDFAVAGRAIRFLNRYILFLNPGIQGLRREVRSAREAPLPFAVKWGLYAMIPALGEMAWNREQGDKATELWREMPAWRKDFFYNLYIGDQFGGAGKWQWITIPKPFTFGVASSFGNRLIDRTFFGNKDAFEDMSSSLKRALVPLDESALLGPLRVVGETMMNKSLFYDEHIVPQYEEGRDPELIGDRGSALGRAGSRALNATLGQVFEKFAAVDPRLVDYFIRGVTSDFGLGVQYTGELINQSLSGDDPKAKSDIAWRLAKLASGNMVRPFKPDQAKDVKFVMSKAHELFGEKEEWFQPIKDSIDSYRDTNDEKERYEFSLDAVYAAKTIKQYLPLASQLIHKDADDIDRVTSQSKAFSKLDKRSQDMVKSLMKSQMFSLSHAIISAKVKNDWDAFGDATDAKDEYDINDAFADAMDEVEEKREKKRDQREDEPLIPRRPNR